MQKTFTSKTVAVLMCGMVATAGFAASHAGGENKSVEARHHQMQMIAYHTGILGGIAKGEMEYDSAMVDAAASNIASLAAMERATLWIEGTEQGAAADSRAKPEIWSDAEGFAAAFEDLETAASAVVGAGDTAAVGAGMGDIGGACKACHEKYRGPEN
ncbi:c-type cytochrome [Sulfitobacter alexandrii]|nr:cytochrome c [Sulfitobacter alexandrii]